MTGVRQPTVPFATALTFDISSKIYASFTGNFADRCYFASRGTSHLTIRLSGMPHVAPSPFTAVSSVRFFLDRAKRRITNPLDRRRDPEASLFYRALMSDGFNANAHIDVLPQQRLIYVSVPKCASTTIKMVLSKLVRSDNGTLCHIPSDQFHRRKYTRLKSPEMTGISAFHRLATSSSTLRFTFVRNPYARIVSAWANKFRGKPLVAGDSYVDLYLALRSMTDPGAPIGLGHTLSFERFVRFAAATSNQRINAHWHMQHGLINMPGIRLDLIGKLETFHFDFACVLEHVAAGPHIRSFSEARLNSSASDNWPDYYTADTAKAVYQAYERDFDELRYAQTASN